MENEYIKSGLLFKKKCIWSILLGFVFENRHRYNSISTSELMFDVIEEIDGNIWRAYLGNHTVGEASFEIKNYCKNNKYTLSHKINDTGYDITTKQLAEALLTKICEFDGKIYDLDAQGK